MELGKESIHGSAKWSKEMLTKQRTMVQLVEGLALTTELYFHET